jgi:hypothetical protein
MIDDSKRKPSGVRKAVLAIAVGGLIAGLLDLGQAVILFGTKIPLAIAAGLLGPQCSGVRERRWTTSVTLRAEAALPAGHRATMLCD